jgi:hypothetical protein
MLDGQRLERWFWLAAFAAILLVSRSVTVTVHQVPSPERADRNAGRREPAPARAETGAATADVRAEEERVAQAYREAQDRLQQFEEAHLEVLVGDGSLRPGPGSAESAEVEQRIKRINELDREIEGTRDALRGVEEEVVEVDRVPNPEYAGLQVRVTKLKAELDRLTAVRQATHPVVQEKAAQYAECNAHLQRMPRYLRDTEVRKPNPRWEQLNAQLDRLRADREESIAEKLMAEKTAITRARLKEILEMRRRHRQLVDRVEHARAELTLAERRKQDTPR